MYLGDTVGLSPGPVKERIILLRNKKIKTREMEPTGKRSCHDFCMMAAVQDKGINTG